LAKIFLRGTPISSAATVFALVSLAYAVGGFQNIGALSVIGAWFCFVVPPLFLLHTTIRSDSRERFFNAGRKIRNVGLVSLLSGAMAYYLFANLNEKWVDYFGNFADERFLSGHGYSIDSVFHISLIESVMEVGYPSTGLHGYPFTPYHALSHYFDAGVYAVTGIAPWEGYSLFFFLKHVALLLSLLYATTRLVKSEKWWASSAIFLLAYPPVIGIGYIVGSHANWLPAIILILAFPRIWRISQTRSKSVSNYLEMTAWVVVISLGKISIGFPLAVFFGVYSMLRISSRLLIEWLKLAAFSGVWLIWFYSFSSIFVSERSSLDFMDRLDRVWAEIWFLVVLAALLAVVGFLRRNRSCFDGAVAIAGFLAVLFLITALVVTTKRADVFLFFSGFSLVAIMMVLALVGASIGNDFSPLTSDRKSREAFSLPAAAIVLLLPATSLAAQSNQLAGFDFRDVVRNVAFANSWPYYWFNEEKELPDRRSVISSLYGFADRDLQADVLLRAREAVQYGRETSPDGQVLLFVSREDFEFLNENFGRGNLRGDQKADLGLFVRSALGQPLIFGAEGSEFAGFGFGFDRYGVDEGWKARADVSEVELCSFGAPVLRLDFIDPEKSVLECVEDQIP
jgi:hypothetical protein